MRKHGAHGHLRAYLQRNISSMGKDKNGLSQELADKVRYFIQDTSPARVSLNLRAILFGYLRNAREGMPVDLDIVLDDMEALFELLDIITDEKRQV